MFQNTFACRLLRYLQMKVGQWQVISASHYPDFLTTANFRQAITIVFLFLVMAMVSMIGSSILIESLVRGHVHDVIINDIYDYSVKSALKRTSDIISQLQHELQGDNNDGMAQVIVIDPQGALVYHNMPVYSMSAEKCHIDVACLKSLIKDASSNNIVGLTVLLQDGGILFRAYNILPMLERVRTIPLVAGTGVFVVLLFCLYVSRQFSLRSLQIVRQIREALHRYSNGEKQVRMPVSSYGNDFDALSADINQNLDRIDRLMEQVRNNAGHIAHELRTPLTHLHNRLYTLSERPDLTVEARKEVEHAVNEVQTVLALFRTVMRIGEIESGRCIHQLSSLSAQELLQDVVEYYQPLAEERACRIVVEQSSDIVMFFDRALVFQALANLIENSLKYASEGGCIRLGYRLYRGWLSLYVADYGPGIQESLQEKATERFERLEQRYSSSGYGLGLSLVKAIAELHGGKVCFQNTHPGLCVYLCLKRCK
ncbi:HAMP domain-containing sensor histidine kinase [uncultured Klebsiella sp.]|uniref:HAMP domain-containing sensor histidine kinase n=1 Tax=uncultured Klebsiella sp. TaxID=284011 RepID=UPI00280623DD|nr:HAMP domain-containing sensor histidine kinase [uncultured Klebsiella sp.]